ncbi:hypothetical protein [Dictyobacter kobayashii]|uniref:Uncharacterized protein n=1 Tax=Dictyobacter kobayashii TaxID=2014872 RepID=A0A402AR81_9CHLR|nr:hypothetical protein [Dictyobacter kobayashii]GCE21602.1 hypothetical protein KDK_54020 [Dictyobacter kobayashii]
MADVVHSNSQHGGRHCAYCGQSVAPLYPVATAEVVAAGEPKRLVCHTCRSLGRGRANAVANKPPVRQAESKTPVVAKANEKQHKNKK